MICRCFAVTFLCGFVVETWCTLVGFLFFWLLFVFHGVFVGVVLMFRFVFFFFFRFLFLRLGALYFAG